LLGYKNNTPPKRWWQIENPLEEQNLRDHAIVHGGKNVEAWIKGVIKKDQMVMILLKDTAFV